MEYEINVFSGISGNPPSFKEIVNALDFFSSLRLNDNGTTVALIMKMWNAFLILAFLMQQST